METKNRKSLSLPSANGSKSARMWRSLDEAAQTPEFTEMVHREFPDSASEWDDGASRRTFLKVMGASLALAGIGGCVRPVTEKIVPYVRQPEELIPGRPLFFASSAMFRGYARGVLVESHEGRPTKIEGNPDHPASLGATDSITQAHILTLYDPDRSQVVNFAGEVSDWNSFSHAILAELAKRKATGGQGIRILTGTITSPTLAEQISSLVTQYPAIRWHQYEAINNDSQKIGLKQAFGVIVEPVYHFEKAKVIVSLDDNFLTDHPGSVRYSRDFIDGRRVRDGNRKMNVLHVAESAPTICGAMADYRNRVKSSEIVNIARAIAAGVGAAPANAQASTASNSPFVQRVVADLQKSGAASLVTAGDGQPAEVHALAAAINSKLGAIGTTVDFIDPVEEVPEIHNDSLQALVNDMNAGSVDVLIMIGGNPVYDAPADLKFVDALDKVKVARVHQSLYYDETSYRCHWHLPLAHELECWSDARAYDGTASVIQPLIAPLYMGRSPHELLSILVGEPDKTGYEIIQGYWRKLRNTPDFDEVWAKWLNNGVVDDSAAKPRSVTLAATATAATAPAPASGELEIIFRPDPYLWDGRHTNNGWLMELPRPLTKLVWDNVAMISPATAQKHGIGSPDDYRSHTSSSIIKLSVNGAEVKAPIWITPGHPDDAVTVYLGYGRTRCGRVGGQVGGVDPVGFNAYTLRTLANPWAQAGLQISNTGESMVLSCTQNHALMDQNDRDLLKVLPISEPTHEENNDEKKTVPLTLYEPWKYTENVQQGNKWGMVIDQNACIGCNACVIACVAENNIAVVGKEQVGKGREMHWLRIDHYYKGNPEKDADVEGPFFQPIPCMNCESAPCELVCPVGATNHDSEGTNNMVYNRCVGTRYCSNNCPYKVRHFNFLHYSKEWIGDHESLKLGENPNVTVRSRGIMEKCTYCIQRIDAARIDAKKEFVQGIRTQEGLKDGEVITACQQVCPTQAIFFGNVNDPTSAVSKLKAETENYILLEELQTRPRTSYLPRYVNKV